MKKYLLYILFCVAASFNLKAADGDLFPYPQPPADMERLDERCDFIISRFWRQCDFKSAMSKSEKLRSTFADWISLMPYATVDTVHASIDRLLASVAKNGQHTLALARMAEDFTYSDTSEIRSAEIFLPFAKAVASNKKIQSSDKEHFISLARKIENTMIGKPVGHLSLTKADGTKLSLDDFHTQMIVLFFNEPGCSDCSLARVRLSADYNIRTLAERGLMTIISINPGKADSQWLESVADYPENWIVGVSPDATEWFELNSSPTIMLLDGRHRLLAKDVTVDGLMAAMAALRQQSGL